MRSLNLARASLLILCTLQATPAPVRMSSQAKQFLDRAFDLVEHGTLCRSQIDWKILRREAEVYAAGAQTVPDTYRAIEYFCAKPRNGMCRLILSPSAPKHPREIDREAAQPSQQRVPLGPVHSRIFVNRAFLYATLSYEARKYGYVVLAEPWWPSPESKNAQRRQRWAETLSGMIERGRAEHVQGWIVDLRGNTGGYLAPFLAGTQSLLGDGLVLKARHTKTDVQYIIHKGKVVEVSSRSMLQMDGRIDEELANQDSTLPVALLQDHETAAAAEGLLVAFKGRGRTAFIGERTAGYAQIGPYLPLGDGATLWVMQGELYDRQGHSYPEGLAPDIFAPDPPARMNIAEDPAVIAAEQWLCKNSD